MSNPLCFCVNCDRTIDTSSINSSDSPVISHSTLDVRTTQFISLADLGGMPGTCHPLWDPILSFSHTFSPKSACVGGPCPPNGCTPPPMGNPGSATAVHLDLRLNTCNLYSTELYRLRIFNKLEVSRLDSRLSSLVIISSYIHTSSFNIT